MRIYTWTAVGLVMEQGLGTGQEGTMRRVAACRISKIDYLGRMQSRLTCASLVVLLLVPFAAAGSEKSSFAVGPIGKRIATWLEGAEAAGFSGAVLAAKDGKVVAALGVGWADPARKLKNTPATLFEIASTTKQFTAAAVMLLVQQGKLRLDDPIAKHLPGVPDDCKAITVRHLLQHTSGIPGSNSRGGGDRLDLVLASFLKGGPQHRPGTHWEYWNQGYALLSEVVARASGESYVTFCKRRLFKPAKMTVTCFTGDSAPRGARVSIGQTTRGRARSALEHPYGSYGFQYRGMGGVVSSVWDLWRWDRALHRGKLLRAPAKKLLFEPGLKSYALGWYVKQDRSGRMVQSHSGSVRGFLADMRRYPGEDGFLVVLCNRDDAPLRRVADGVEAILFGGNARPLTPRPGALDAELAAILVGTYSGPRGRVLKVMRMRGALRFELHWSPPNGAVTRGRVGKQGAAVVFDDGSKQYPIKTTGPAGKPVQKIVWMKDSYSRKEG